ncbi:hypothetical protein BDY19DRAFT_590483 [Irpex rosettiformis]|uniref:Uncharacterized protein n=1 Tax=Irpex rosettiformis TaxID=378272 RepID=A0ACB8UD96_9APHY|nr:hypothetical protein BDY19DRAFT_590483 [Irpex rosettiformis]
MLFALPVSNIVADIRVAIEACINVLSLHFHFPFNIHCSLSLGGYLPDHLSMVDKYNVPRSIPDLIDLLVQRLPSGLHV